MLIVYWNVSLEPTLLIPSLFILFPRLACIRPYPFWGHATEQTIRSCRCSFRIKAFCCLIPKSAQGFWHFVCFVPSSLVKQAFYLCGILTSLKSMVITMHYVWKLVFWWFLVDSSFGVIQKWVQSHAPQPLRAVECVDPFQPLIRIKYPSSLTLFDGLVIKLISRVSWSEYSLLCAHTLCNTISSLAKVSLTKQTRDKKELCDKCSTCRDRVGKELMNSIFLEQMHYLLDTTAQDFIIHENFCLSVSYLVIRMMMEMLLGDARVLGVVL